MNNKIQDTSISERIVDIVEHFAGQTILDVVMTLTARLNQYEGDLYAEINSLIEGGVLELDARNHLRLAPSDVEVTKQTKQQLHDDNDALTVHQEEIAPSSVKVGIMATLAKMKKGFIELNGKRVRLDPYSHKPAPEKRWQDGAIYFEAQKYNLRSYSKYVQKVGVEEAVHPYEWMIQSWITSGGDPLVNSNPRLKQLRRDKAKLYDIEAEDLFGEYWRGE